MNKNGKFGKSLFGFKRADVIDYIEKAAADSFDTVNEKDKIIKKLSEQNEQLIHDNAQLNEQVKAVEAEFAQMRMLATELKKEIGEFETKSKQIGEAYVEAKVSADKIIRDASESADNIVKSANTCAEKTLSKITDAQSDIVNAKRSFYDMMNEFEKRLDSISVSISSAKARISPTGFNVNSEITEDDLLSHSILPEKK